MIFAFSVKKELVWKKRKVSSNVTWIVKIYAGISNNYYEFSMKSNIFKYWRWVSEEKIYYLDNFGIVLIQGLVVSLFMLL